MAFGRKNKRLFIVAFLFGAGPDVVAFGWEFVRRILAGSGWHGPMVESINSYIFSLYNITHSLVISVAILLCGLIVFKSKALPFAAWPLHILFDIPVHSTRFFPTPYLWPFATPFFDGIPWVTPWVFFLNWAALIVLLVAWKVFGNKKVL
ncbi:MAG: hypothetical protein COU73_01545 [Parcubacteria group bacterium CG10_big_fil_rev_8_21_14_0_10_46_32]|nr:MAG: hypothetical protein COU73_01545 [Parcubacteria group bacterium CG10_big_fil_rev_8_21_14_0_10_46_32]